MDQSHGEREKNTPDLSHAIDQIMAHPEWISMVASALGKSAEPSSVAEPPEEKEETPPSSAPTDSVAALTPMLSKLSQIKPSANGGRSQRGELLCALKPYLSPGRQEAIDYMIRLSQISDLLKHLT